MPKGFSRSDCIPIVLIVGYVLIKNYVNGALFV